MLEKILGIGLFMGVVVVTTALATVAVNVADETYQKVRDSRGKKKAKQITATVEKPKKLAKAK